MGVTKPATRRSMTISDVFERRAEKFRPARTSPCRGTWSSASPARQDRAIRHCNVGFAGTSQDELRGSGTLNANWWFHQPRRDARHRGQAHVRGGQASSSKGGAGVPQTPQEIPHELPVNGMLLVSPESLIQRHRRPRSRRRPPAEITRQLDTVQLLHAAAPRVRRYHQGRPHQRLPRVLRQRAGPAPAQMLGWSNRQPRQPVQP